MKMAFSLEAPNSAIDTGKVTDIDPAPRRQHHRPEPLPGPRRVVRCDGDWGHVQAAAIVRQVGFQNPATPDGKPSGEKTGYGLNLSGALNAFGKDRINWQVVGGKAIASYMNDGGIDLAPGASLQAETVKSLGWLAYYNHAWSDKWSSSIGYSEHRQNNTGGQLHQRLPQGQLCLASICCTRRSRT